MNSGNAERFPRRLAESIAGNAVLAGSPAEAAAGNIVLVEAALRSLDAALAALRNMDVVSLGTAGLEMGDSGGH